jgi:drug/metabolite transporter (DMT)-like permease
MNVVQPLTGVDPAVVGSSVSMLGSLDGWVVAVWLLLAWVVVVGTVTPFALELHALQLLPATTVVGLAMLEPVGVNVLGWAWFGEKLDPVQLVGAAGVVVAIGLAQTARSESVPVPGPVGP